MAYPNRPYRWHTLVDTAALASVADFAVTEVTPPTYTTDGATVTPDDPGTYAIAAAAAASAADDADLDALIVPANNEFEVHSMRGYVFAASASSRIELCLEDDTVLCELIVSASGHVSAVNAGTTTPTTFPITVSPQSETLPKLLKLKVQGTLDPVTKVAIDVVLSAMK